ncbi:MAG: M28 family peptidase [Akkermansiaceae bacterium]
MKKIRFRILRSVLRIFVALLVIIVPTRCFIMQPTGASEIAKLSADPEILKSEVRALTENFGPRYYDQTETIAKCRAYMREKFRKHGAQVEEQEYQIGKDVLYNVRALIGSKTDPRIVVGAHYDVCTGHDDFDKPGADDNASGVAGLFGLARLLQKQAPEGVAVELVAYNTEEPPFFGGKDMGSYHHAKLLKDEGIDVKGVIILEMIGYFSDDPDSQQYPIRAMRLAYPSKGNFIALTGGVPDRDLIETSKKAMKGSAPLPVYSSCIPRSFDLVHLSDHRNYWPFGFKAIMVTDTSFYRNPHYHLASDTWDTLDYDRMAHVVTQVHQAILAVAKK